MSSSTDASRLVVTIAANPPPRLDKALARDVPDDAALSRSRLAKMIAEGAVSRNGAPLTDPRAKVAEGDTLTLTIPAAEDTDILPEAIPIDVVYEDDDLIVVNKPAGMVVHPAPGSPRGTLVNALLAHCGEGLLNVGGVARPGVVHRIDKDTSGLLVAAKTDRAHQGLSDQFAAHTVERLYTAICYGAPDAGDPRLRGIKGVSFEDRGVIRITTQLARHKTDRQRQAVLFQGGRHAITRLRVDERFGTPGAVAARVSCWLETGRTHQIRVHLAHAGHGLVGDPTYGGRRALSPRILSAAGVAAARDFSRQALHAGVLGFEHPVTGAAHRFEAPLPSDLVALCDALRQPPG